MGLIIKFFSFLLVLGVAGLFFIKKPDGSAWLSLDDFTPDTSAIKRSISDAMPDQVVGGSDGDKVSVYKWKDAEGNWQFSDKPPTSTEAKQVLVGTDVNRDLAPLPPPTRTSSPSSTSDGKAVLIKDSGFSPTTISPDKISKLVDDANGVQGLVDNRKKELDDALKSTK